MMDFPFALVISFFIGFLLLALGEETWLTGATWFMVCWIAANQKDSNDTRS